MAITLNPSGPISFATNNAPVTLTVSGGTPGATITVTPSFSQFESSLFVVNPVTSAVVDASGDPVLFSIILAGSGQAGNIGADQTNISNSVEYTVTDSISLSSQTIFVQIEPNVDRQQPALSPYTCANLISNILFRTNESTTTVSNARIQFLLNQAMLEVSQGLDPVSLYVSLPVPSGANIVFLPSDIQEIKSLSWSNIQPSAAGTLVYRLTQMDPGTFMDFSGGVPGTGFGNPIAYTIIADAATATGSNQYIQLYPSPTGGFINIYYVARPLPFTDTLSSTTNMDMMAMEPLILWCCARVCEARERTSDADRFAQQYQAVMAAYQDTIARRTRPKTGIVRDVTNMGATGAPPWLF